jgi:hypothetical protein
MLGPIDLELSLRTKMESCKKNWLELTKQKSEFDDEDSRSMTGRFISMIEQDFESARDTLSDLIHGKIPTITNWTESDLNCVLH